MSKTSSAVKDRYNAKAYDEIKVRVPKGRKEIIQAHSEATGESVNGFINRAISETMERDKTAVSRSDCAEGTEQEGQQGDYMAH